MTPSFPKVDPLRNVNLWAMSALHLTLRVLEGAYSQWHQPLSTADATFGLMLVIGWGLMIYITEWGDVVAQYWPRELFRDRVFTFWDVWIPGFAGFNAVWFLWEGPRQTGMEPWDEVIRVVFALLLVIGAIPGVVHMWVAFKNRQFSLGRPQSKIG